MRYLKTFFSHIVALFLFLAAIFFVAEGICWVGVVGVSLTAKALLTERNAEIFEDLVTLRGALYTTCDSYDQNGSEAVIKQRDGLRDQLDRTDRWLGFLENMNPWADYTAQDHAWVCD